MTTEVTLHRCQSIKVLSTYVSNGNAIRLGITDAEGLALEISFYDLSKTDTDKLVLAFGDGETRHFKPDPEPEIENFGVEPEAAPARNAGDLGSRASDQACAPSR